MLFGCATVYKNDAIPGRMKDTVVGQTTAGLAPHLVEGK